MTVIMGSFNCQALIIMVIVKSKIQILPMMPCKKCTLNFKSDILKKQTKTGYFQIIAPAVVYWPFLVIKNKSERIRVNIFGDTVIESLKTGENSKKWPQGMKNLRIYSWCFLPGLKHDQKYFIRIPSFNCPEMRPLCTLSQSYQAVTMETITVTNL